MHIHCCWEHPEANQSVFWELYVWLKISINRLLLPMENLYWSSVRVNSSGRWLSDIGVGTLHTSGSGALLNCCGFAMLLSMPCNASRSHSSEAALHWAWSTTRSVHCALANDKLLSLSEKTVIRVMMITTIIWMMVCIFSELSYVKIL